MAKREALLEALLDGAPDGLILCDGLLRPLRASAAALGTAVLTGAPDTDGEPSPLAWSHTALGMACREAAALALDRAGVASLICALSDTRWEIRAAPLDHPDAHVCLSLRPDGTTERDTLVRAAHDLKAPLHSIAGFGTLLRHEQLGPLSAQQRDALATLVGETERLKLALTALVERVRTGDTVGEDPLSPACRPAADLQTVAHETVTRFSALAAASGVMLEAAAGAQPTPAALSKEDAGTILDNLVTNALAAAPRTVRLLTGSCESGMAVVRVEDDGPGIPEDMLERIFLPRVRLGDRGAPDGSGLGLTIARALAVRAGGTLTAAQRPSGGAVFTLRVPAAPPDGPHVLRVAPVTSHAALARAQAALDATGTWRHVEWRSGVLTVEVGREDERNAAVALGRAGLACW